LVQSLPQPLLNIVYLQEPETTAIRTFSRTMTPSTVKVKKRKVTVGLSWYSSSEKSPIRTPSMGEKTLRIRM
jgi:hypothetical protein